MTRFKQIHDLERAESLLELMKSKGWDTTEQEAFCRKLREELPPEDDSLMGMMEEINEMVRAV